MAIRTLFKGSFYVGVICSDNQLTLCNQYIVVVIGWFVLCANQPSTT